MSTNEATKIDPIEKLIGWIKEKSGDIEIDDQTDLLETRIITSLRFVSFLLMIEELSGKDMSGLQGDIDKFRSLGAIRANFFN